MSFLKELLKVLYPYREASILLLKPIRIAFIGQRSAGQPLTSSLIRSMNIRSMNTNGRKANLELDLVSDISSKFGSDSEIEQIQKADGIVFVYNTRLPILQEF